MTAEYDTVKPNVSFTGENTWNLLNIVFKGEYWKSSFIMEEDFGVHSI